MEIELVDKAEKDFEFWNNSNNTKIRDKISTLIKDMLINPETGLGKPEKLKYDLVGYWSRRINREHRIIYKINYEENKIFIHSLKGHYEK